VLEKQLLEKKELRKEFKSQIFSVDRMQLAEDRKKVLEERDKYASIAEKNKKCTTFS
jgi:hypothetical protein